MCGRFTQTKSREDVKEQLANIELPPLFHGRYNVAPNQPVALIRQQTPNKAEESMWGFKNSASLIINARTETIRERPTFKGLVDNHRCLILADGFYEWKGKQPYYFQTEHNRLFAFGGLWRDGHCVIITRQADKNMQGIHDRMPLIIPQENWTEWLHVPYSLPPEPPTLHCRTVSTRVNKVKNDDKECLSTPPTQTDLFD